MNAVNIDASHITRRWAKNCLPPYDGISRPRAYCLRRSWKAEDLGEQGGGGSCENVLGQNLKNGGGRRVGGPGGEAGSEVTGGTEFPSYPPLTPRTGSGRDPGELHCNYLTNISITKKQLRRIQSSLPLPQSSFIFSLHQSSFILSNLST